jgi:site-specific DNA recombinase
MFELRGANGGVYKRASYDTAAGTAMEGMSVESQGEEANERADELGINIVDVYNDNNLSSSEYRQKERKDWPRMLSDIAAGKLQVIIMWDTSRGSRDLEDWVKFLKLIAKHEVLIHAVSHDRTYNPNNHRDWETLASDGVKNAAFSKQLSANVKRGFKKSARLGRPRGTAAFGWKRVYDPDSGKMMTQEPVEELRKYVVEVFDRFVTGTPCKALAIEWNWRNRAPKDHPNWVPLSRDGKPWRHDSIRNLLRNPVYIGKLRDRTTGELLEGNWEGFIDEGTWWTAQRLMEPHKGNKDPRAKYLLTMIARCGYCGSRVGPQRQTYYSCVGKEDDGAPKATGAGCTGMKIDWVDEIVVEAMADKLMDAKFIAKLSETDTAQQAEARARARELAAELDAAWAKVYAHAPGYSHDRVAQMAASWEPEIQRLEEVAAAGLDTGKALALAIHRDAQASGVQGNELKKIIVEAIRVHTPLPGQRNLVRMLCPSIRILKADNPGGKKLDRTRVEIDGVRAKANP